MERNWLIRTKKKQILGPVSKEKIKEFIKKGILKKEDEVTSGNGYWFFIREKDLLDRYIYGDLPQTFNPVTEAESVLVGKNEGEYTASINPSAIPRGTGEQDLLPSDRDLDFPTAGEDNSATDNTAFFNVSDLNLEIGSKNLGQVSHPEIPASSEVSGKLPQGDDLEFPTVVNGPALTEVSFEEKIEASEEERITFEVPQEEDSQEESSQEGKTGLEGEKKEVSQKKQKPLKLGKGVKRESRREEEDEIEEEVAPSFLKKMGDRYLVYIFILTALSILYGAYYYYTTILGKEVPFVGMSDVHAQEFFVKKKT